MEHCDDTVAPVFPRDRLQQLPAAATELIGDIVERCIVGDPQLAAAAGAYGMETVCSSLPELFLSLIPAAGARPRSAPTAIRADGMSPARRPSAGRGKGS